MSEMMSNQEWMWEREYALEQMSLQAEAYEHEQEMLREMQEEMDGWGDEDWEEQERQESMID